MPDTMIKTEHLTKHYGPLRAVEDVSFEVRPGEVLGFLGPNGAGKTTTMRMLAGFVTPTSGRASICGHDVESAPLAAKAALGYLPEGFSPGRAAWHRHRKGATSRSGSGRRCGRRGA